MAVEGLVTASPASTFQAVRLRRRRCPQPRRDGALDHVNDLLRLRDRVPRVLNRNGGLVVIRLSAIGAKLTERSAYLRANAWG
jgi:hypothetical protein